MENKKLKRVAIDIRVDQDPGFYETSAALSVSGRVRRYKAGSYLTGKHAKNDVSKFQ